MIARKWQDIQKAIQNRQLDRPIWQTVDGVYALHLPHTGLLYVIAEHFAADHHPFVGELKSYDNLPRHMLHPEDDVVYIPKTGIPVQYPDMRTPWDCEPSTFDTANFTIK